MVGACGFGRQQQEDQIDRLIVDRFEIDRLFKPGKQPVQALKFGQLAVRNGDALAHAGCAEPFALEQHVEDLALVETRNCGGPVRELLQRLLFAGRAQGNVHVLGGQEVRDFHSSSPHPLSVRVGFP